MKLTDPHQGTRRLPPHEEMRKGMEVGEKTTRHGDARERESYLVSRARHTENPLENGCVKRWIIRVWECVRETYGKRVISV
jgi:hypothetical protein